MLFSQTGRTAFVSTVGALAVIGLDCHLVARVGHDLVRTEIAILPVKPNVSRRRHLPFDEKENGSSRKKNQKRKEGKKKERDAQRPDTAEKPLSKDQKVQAKQVALSRKQAMQDDRERQSE
ncbi:hypothetical protein CAOG_009357 [Capsaspora owczarzaki ATCC 30864]|uniref:Uncharacterized protein n=1 Tax=Capsaspora owczarzaki (strain ATCC 30864) TaxID=595528 RepID=A0A0D2WJA5_CAPO3|nr:hypothetical protein CAOG_009357 [Capsaspora owczarzaki ATCC 30864]